MTEVKPQCIPYGRHQIDDEDVAAVVDVLRSDWLTTGPAVRKLESHLADVAGADEAVALNSGSAALHAAMAACGIDPGDEVIVPAITFASTANAILHRAGVPVFADIDADTLLIDCNRIDACITPKTRAIICVDYAGQPCDYRELQEIAKHHNIPLVADACHSLGGSYNDQPVGGLADITTFSFHPVKVITTGEGGAITTNNGDWARSARSFRNHGLNLDHSERHSQQTYHYDMVDLGFNYRLSDIGCALGLSQLTKLSAFVDQRRILASEYHRLLADVPGIEPLARRTDRSSAWHLFVVRVQNDAGKTRDQVFAEMRKQGIGVNVHYLPVYLHQYYRQTLGFKKGLCPVAEAMYEQILSLPLFPSLQLSDVHYVVDCLKRALNSK